MRATTNRRASAVGTLASARSVKQAMLEKVKKSDLTEQDSKLLRFEPYEAASATKLNLPAAFAGFKIPYFDLEGRVTKFWRFRYLETTKTGFDAITDKKALRYAQPKRSLNELYVPPVGGTNWSILAKDPSLPLIITEGELKAACATKHGHPTIGLGGVWCFKSNAERMPLLPMFREIQWKGRTVYICYDSDAVTNHMVMQAENALARELMLMGAEPLIVRLPELEGEKTGLDDYIVHEGPEAFGDLLSTATGWRAAQELFALNEEVVYVRDPGVILRMTDLQRISPRAFVDHAYSTRIYYEEQVTQNGTKMVERSAAKEWLKWPSRAEVAKVTYAPGRERITERNELNVWKGWGVEPEVGDITLWNQLLDFMFRSDVKARRWFEQWCAYPLQKPGTKLYSACVIHGTSHGTGKSLIGYTLGAIYGSNFTEIDDEDIHSSHNEWAENKQLVLGDEITGGDKRAVSERLKRMITRLKIRLNPKYVPSYEVPDCINYYFTSNHPDSFFLEDQDRRYFIWEVVGQPLPEAFYVAFDKALKNGDLPRALFAHLLKLDLTGFNPHAPAMVTDAKKEMIDSGRSDIGQWVAQLKDDPDTVLRVDTAVISHDLWRAEELLALYDPQERKRVTANGMARELKRAGFVRPAGTVGVRTINGQVRLWAVRNMDRYAKMNLTQLGEAYDRERTPGGRKDEKSTTKKKGKF